MAEPVKLIVIGAGGRGTGYSNLVKNMNGEAQIVGVAEPRDFYRERIVREHNVAPEHVFHSWDEVTKVPKFADGVLICTQDNMHEEPAIQFAKMGYHILLEKPMAPTADARRRIVAAVREAKIKFGVCHVLRYTKFTQMIKKIIADGTIGDVISIQHLEPVAHWHQCHSFVRGNWRNEEESSFMLLAKCCHDIDWIRYVMNKPCTEIQSFGELSHFKKECQPKGAADRCVDCPTEIESFCPASALKIYLRDRMAKGQYGWPTDVLTSDLTPESVAKALREGPYGRCAYKCDNDVVDHQVVNMLFADGSTAQMTMTAFCNEAGRQTRIFGTRGSILTDSRMIHITDFLTNETKTVDTELVNDGSILSGHGGGDGGVIGAFVKALATGDDSYILTGLDETLESHLMVFAAEKSRHENKVLAVSE